MRFSTPMKATDLASTILGRPRGTFLPPEELGPFLRRVRARIDLLFGRRLTNAERDALLKQVLGEIIETERQLTFSSLEDFGVLINSLMARRAERK